MLANYYSHILLLCATLTSCLAVSYPWWDSRPLIEAVSLSSPESRIVRVSSFKCELFDTWFLLCLAWNWSHCYSSCSSSYACWAVFFKTSLKLHCFQWHLDEIWQECFSSKYASTDCLGFSNFTSHFQDGGHDIILCRKMSPGECTWSICWARMQQCPQVSDP